MWNPDILEELRQKKEAASRGGGAERAEKQHAAGKLTARERLEILFDPGTFLETDTLWMARPGAESAGAGGIPEDEKDGSRAVPGNANDRTRAVPGDGVVTGCGKINGRMVYAYSEDFTVLGGTLGETHSLKICRIQDLALQNGCPIVAVCDSGGARIQEGIRSIAGYSGIFRRNTLASGVIPQIAVMLGPCAGGACYSPAICDFIFMTEHTARMFITGPTVVRSAIHEEISSEELGGAQVHAERSGVAHFVYPDDRTCLLGVRKLLSYLPQNREASLPLAEPARNDRSGLLQEIVPENMRLSYDVRDVIRCIADEDSFLEIQERFAGSLAAGFARMDGSPIGIIASQPCVAAGTLDIDASDKAARFIRFCDCFNIPLLTLVDSPGFMPGKKQEHGGIIRHGAKLLYAYCEATVPKVTLILRKAFGGAYIAMNSKYTGADYVYAWPIAQIAVMGPEGAVDILHRRRLAESGHPEEERKALTEAYQETFLNPYIGAENGCIDDVIHPDETAEILRRSFEALRRKEAGIPKKKHGNIPL